MLQNKIEEIRNGVALIHNDSSYEDLCLVLEGCFPVDGPPEPDTKNDYYGLYKEGSLNENIVWRSSPIRTTCFKGIDKIYKVSDLLQRNKSKFKIAPISDKIKSDGGSNCGYYTITLPKEVLTLNENGSVSFQVKDIIQSSLGNDFDKGNIYKALHRLGNKEGIDVEYDLKKIEHTVKEMILRNKIDNEQETAK